MANYVKFKRGLIEDFQNLKTKESDTLYFIYDTDETIAELWLGNKKIASSNSMSFAGLQDVLISEVKDKDLLIYESGNWINKSFKDLIDEALISMHHVYRIVLNTIDEIYDYINEVNYTQYIFMIPSNSQENKNKYDEYIIFESSNGERFIEQIGNFNINESYVTKEEFLNLENKISNLTPQSFNPNHFQKIDGILHLNNDITSTLNTIEHTYVSIKDFNTAVGDLNSLLAKKDNLQEKIEDLEGRLIWQNIDI